MLQQQSRHDITDIQRQDWRADPRPQGQKTGQAGAPGCCYATERVVGMAVGGRMRKMRFWRSRLLRLGMYLEETRVEISTRRKVYLHPAIEMQSR